MSDPILTMNEEELRAEILRLRRRNHEISNEYNRKLASYQSGFAWIEKTGERAKMYVRRNEFEWAGVCVFCDIIELRRQIEKERK
jgi:hypothetical protein